MHNYNVIKSLKQNCDIYYWPLGSGVQALGWGQNGHKVKNLYLKNLLYSHGLGAMEE